MQPKPFAFGIWGGGCPFAGGDHPFFRANTKKPRG